MPAPCTYLASKVGTAPHPAAATFSPYRDGVKEAEPDAAPASADVEKEAGPLTPPSPRLLAGEGEGQRQPVQAAARPAETVLQAPAAEIAPPIRQPAPIESQPVIAEIAPEPQSVPQPAAEAKPRPGKVTVTKKVEQKAEPIKAPEPVPRRSWFQRMRDGLSRSSRELTGNIAGVFTKRKLDEETLQDLEDVLIRADLGMETALRITDALAASLPMVVVLPVPLTPTTRMTCGLCDRSSSSGMATWVSTFSTSAAMMVRTSASETSLP